MMQADQPLSEALWLSRRELMIYLKPNLSAIWLKMSTYPASSSSPEVTSVDVYKRQPVGEVTGTSDKLPVEAQLKMIREILPEAKNIGIMYTTSEEMCIRDRSHPWPV